MHRLSMLLAFFIFTAIAAAQSITLRGLITDESGASVPGATVTLKGPGPARVAQTSRDGAYVFQGLPTGTYKVEVAAPDLALAKPTTISLKATSETLNLILKVAATSQQVTVQDSAAPTVTTDPTNNAGALVMRGDDLLALADNPEDLQADLLALAGPSAGPNGGQIFVDGFSGGELPPKESIREIRINQNPFSPEYDTIGYGRIEIFTKPGADKFRGSVYYNFADDFWNSRNPYAAKKSPFLLNETGGNVSGPLGKRASFTLDGRYDSVNDGAIINGITLDPVTLGVVDPFTSVFVKPQRRFVITPRVDFQLNANNTLTVRYSGVHTDIDGSGVGSFNLPSRAQRNIINLNSLQMTETAVLSPTVINETRFQFTRLLFNYIADSSDPALIVLSAFNGGGAQIGNWITHEKDYELQNNTSIAHGSHTLRFGMRLRGYNTAETFPQNFGGSFIFGGGTAPVLDPNNRAVVDATGQPRLTDITSIERYRRTVLFQKLGFTPAQIRALGGGATQFTINAGNPSIAGNQWDAGIFAGDDWRVRPNLTVSYGLRYEVQTNLSDWRALAPRAGIAWGVGATNKKPALFVVRGGFGIFYERFALSNTLRAARANGIVEQQYVVTNPDFFPVVPPATSLGGTLTTQTIQRVSPALKSPSILQGAIGIERQLPWHSTLAVTFAKSHGIDIYRSRVSNAASLSSSVGPIFQSESSGVYDQNQLIFNLNTKVNRNVSVFTGYTLNRARSNTDGLGTFPANPSSDQGEYGPASTDVHNRAQFGGTLNSRWDLRISPLVIVESGPPFDITAGRDIYGTTLYNGRPGIASELTRPGLVETPYGLLDPNPIPGEQILPRNFGRGPGQVLVNFRIGKVFGFGGPREGATAAGSGPAMSGGQDARRGGGGNPFSTGGAGGAPASSKRYNLTISLSIRNAFNHNNPGPIVGNITSPLFGRANQPAASGGGFSEAANNRRLEIQTRFTF